MKPKISGWKFASVLMVVLLLIAGGVGAFAFYRVTPKTRIGLEGAEGLAFDGTINADGRVFSVSGRLPTDFIVPARKLECSFVKRNAPGRLALRIYSSEASFQQTYTDKSKGGVRGTVTVSEAGLGSSKYSKRESSVSIFEL